MNKYELDGNIIKTTEERYERTFKNLGYVPYKEKKAEVKAEEKEVKKSKKMLKED